jgi:anti-anti-sigma regulatory factor
MPIFFRAPARLDAESVKSLRSDFEQLANATDDVVVDMARTDAIDGSGVGAMVFAFKRLSAKGKRLSVRNVSGQPLDLLNDAGLLRTLAGDRFEGRPSRLQAIVRSLRPTSRLTARTTAPVALVVRALRNTEAPRAAATHVEPAGARTKGAA